MKYIYQQTKAISRKSKTNNTKGNKNAFSFYVDAFWMFFIKFLGLSVFNMWSKFFPFSQTAFTRIAHMKDIKAKILKIHPKVQQQ